MRKIRWAILESVLGMGKPRDHVPSKLIVGLGNPGKEHAETRHNVGFWCVERLAKEGSIDFVRRHSDVVIGEGVIAGTQVALAKPRTYVNNSGQAISYLLARYKASPADLLVVYDDMDLPTGEMRLRPRGSAGGHKGMKSIVQAIGTHEFARLRMGIGRPPAGEDDIGYVLGTMSPEEQEGVEEAVERATQAIICTLTEGITVAMNRFN